jgi:formylglycine-generating enzyme required for sulfatase activity
MFDSAIYQRKSIQYGILLAGLIPLLFLSVDFFSRVSGAFSPPDLATAVIQTEPLAAVAVDESLPKIIESKLVLRQTVPLVASPRVAIEAPSPGTQKRSPVDGMTLIYVPAGHFRMGSYARFRQSTLSEQSSPQVYLDAFWISRTQVTNAMYSACVAAGACNKPIRKEINPHYYDHRYKDHPVVYVTWSDAQLYCAWIGGRLPTEAEWEKAARAEDWHAYAWGGADPGPKYANVNNSQKSTTSVGKYPDGASPYGVLDLGGNVREWVGDWFVSSLYLPSPPDNPVGPDKGSKRVLKSASWFDPAKFSRISNRQAHEPESAGYNRGFRCAVPAVEGVSP